MSKKNTKSDFKSPCGGFMGLFAALAFFGLSIGAANAQDVMLKKNFGGSNTDTYSGVTATSDGIVAVGNSSAPSFNTGDWAGTAGKGGWDAIIVKYDKAGNVMWKKTFGGSGNEGYISVIATSDGGIVAVGYSGASSFNNGDWTGTAGKGSNDAIIVKYDNAGNVMWKKNFGGSDDDFYRSVTATSDGIVAVGYSIKDSFGNGSLINAIRQRGNVEAYGIDISPNMIEECRKRYTDIDFSVSTGEKLGFADETFDAVTICCVLHHLHDPQRFFEEVRRVLKHGGILIVGEPWNPFPIKQLMDYILSPLLRAGDNKTFTRKRLRRLFNKNCFTILPDSYEKEYMQVIKARSEYDHTFGKADIQHPTCAVAQRQAADLPRADR